MSWEVVDPQWSDADVDAADLWARSGGQWLTAPGVAVPVELVRGAVGLARCLDAQGAGLADLVGADGVGVIGERAAALGLSPSGPATGRAASCGGASRILPCADGWVVATLARDDDIAAVPAWLGVDLGGPHWPIVERAVADRACAEVVEQATLLGLACARLGEVGEMHPVRGRRLGDAAPKPLEGLVVANLSSLWAGPLAGDVLARMGARVVKVESEYRPDGSRRAGRFFEALHGRCESVALPLHTDDGCRQLGELLSNVDVVIEGSRPRALQQLGIDAVTLTERHPQIWVSITAYGRDGASGHRVGFGDDTAVAGNLVGWVGESPTFLADAVADPVTGLSVAAVIAQLANGGGRWLVDVALAHVAASMSPRSNGTIIAADQGSVRPKVRSDPGRPLPLGRDTATVLDEFGIRSST